MCEVMAPRLGPIVSDDGGDWLHFYLSSQVASVPVDGTFYVSYTGPGDTHPRTGLGGYADTIRHGYFSVILPEFVGGPRDCLIWARKGRQ
jgi:hypothetical protein